MIRVIFAERLTPRIYTKNPLITCFNPIGTRRDDWGF